MSVRFSFALVALSAFSLALAAAAGGHASAADQLAQAKPADANLLIVLPRQLSLRQVPKITA